MALDAVNRLRGGFGRVRSPSSGRFSGMATALKKPLTFSRAVKLSTAGVFGVLTLAKLINAITSSFNSWNLMHAAEDRGDFVHEARWRQALGTEVNRMLAWGTVAGLTAMGAGLWGLGGAALLGAISYLSTNYLLPPQEKIDVVDTQYASGHNSSPPVRYPDPAGSLGNGRSPYGDGYGGGGSPYGSPYDSPYAGGMPPGSLGGAGGGYPVGGLTRGAGGGLGENGPPIINISVQGGTAQVSDVANDVTGAK